MRIVLGIILMSVICITSCEKKIHQVAIPGSFTDYRDSTKYSTITIGNDTWMTQNLSYLPKLDTISNYSESKPKYYLLYYAIDTLDDPSQEDYRSEFGVLYNWIAALSACPEGWHLPTDLEWQEMESFLGMSLSETGIEGWRVTNNVDIKMKSTFGWALNDNGNNISGFNARPAGFTNQPVETDSVGRGAYFWTHTSNIENLKVLSRTIRVEENGVARYWTNRSRGLSVRCVRDHDN